MPDNKQNLTEEDKQYAATLMVKELIYETVISELKIDHNDEIYVALITGMLKRQTKDHIIFSIWNNLEEAQIVHLKNFVGQMAISAPWMNQDAVLMEFAMMHPSLKKKVHRGLSEFFKGFIAKFNEISEA